LIHVLLNVVTGRLMTGQQPAGFFMRKVKTKTTLDSLVGLVAHRLLMVFAASEKNLPYKADVRGRDFSSN